MGKIQDYETSELFSRQLDFISKKKKCCKKYKKKGNFCSSCPKK